MPVNPFDDPPHFAIVMAAVSKIFMQKYFAQTRANKNGKEFNIGLYLSNLNKKTELSDKIELKKILKYSYIFIDNRLKGKDNDKFAERFLKLATKPGFYDAIVEEIEENGVDVAAIQAFDLEKLDENPASFIKRQS